MNIKIILCIVGLIYAPPINPGEGKITADQVKSKLYKLTTISKPQILGTCTCPCHTQYTISPAEVKSKLYKLTASDSQGFKCNASESIELYLPIADHPFSIGQVKETPEQEKPWYALCYVIPSINKLMRACFVCTDLACPHFELEFTKNESSGLASTILALYSSKIKFINTESYNDPQIYLNLYVRDKNKMTLVQTVSGWNVERQPGFQADPTGVNNQGSFPVAIRTSSWIPDTTLFRILTKKPLGFRLKLRIYQDYRKTAQGDTVPIYTVLLDEIITRVMHSILRPICRAFKELEFTNDDYHDSRLIARSALNIRLIEALDV